MADIEVTSDSDALIFPLGVYLDPKIVRAMLQVALNNNLITLKQLTSIEGYEILKGDNSVHKSVIANGLGYDMYKYQQKGKDYFYANYPHNDLGQDPLHYVSSENKTLIQHPFGGTGNLRRSSQRYSNHTSTSRRSTRSNNKNIRISFSTMGYLWIS